MDTVLYDGNCRFCTSGVRSLRWLDWTKRLSYLSLHDPGVAERYPDLSYEMLMREMWVVAKDGRKFGGADAFRYLSTKLIPLLPVALVMHIPGTMPLWRWMYRQIAVRRYRIAGKHCDDGTCSLHGR